MIDAALCGRGLVGRNRGRVLVAAAVAIASMAAIRAQSPTGRMAFEVSSIKPSKGPVVPSNVPLTPWDDYSPVNGRFRADASLRTYLEFAYKLWPNELQSRELSHLPKWAETDRYTVEARAATANPTKDEMRLMVQSLLADRFQLATHFDAREVPVFELKLAKTGQLGPRLISHADGPPCDKPGTSPGDGLPGFPGDCHSLSAIDKPGTMLILVGSRDVTIDVLTGALSISARLGRPVIDKTGLKGRFDFTLEWEREPRTSAAADSPAPPSPAGPTPLEALRDQLGLKLEPAKASLPILVIDRAERPSEN